MVLWVPNESTMLPVRYAKAGRIAPTAAEQKLKTMIIIISPVVANLNNPMKEIGDSWEIGSISSFS
jgi:hypothetical protein